MTCECNPAERMEVLTQSQNQKETGTFEFSSLHAPCTHVKAGEHTYT